MLAPERSMDSTSHGSGLRLARAQLNRYAVTLHDLHAPNGTAGWGPSRDRGRVRAVASCSAQREAAPPAAGPTRTGTAGCWQQWAIIYWRAGGRRSCEIPELATRRRMHLKAPPAAGSIGTAGHDYGWAEGAAAKSRSGHRDVEVTVCLTADHGCPSPAAGDGCCKYFMTLIRQEEVLNPPLVSADQGI